MKGDKSTKVLLVILIAGLFLLLYPTVSNYWNQYHQTRAKAVYSHEVQEMDSKEYQQMLQEARAYNQRLMEKKDRYVLSEEETREYEGLLDAGGTGVMGYLEIPELKIQLPVYHGVEESTLQAGIGHMPGTSLPTGGPGTHCVLTGHTGLASASLLTNLDQMEEGDIFALEVLDEKLTYQVDQIRVVKPEKLNDLQLVPGEDYCTLVTCTPYGVNSHRLLVRGRRVENQQIPLLLQNEAKLVSSRQTAPFIALILLGITGFCFWIKKRILRRKGEGKI